MWAAPGEVDAVGQVALFSQGPVPERALAETCQLSIVPEAGGLQTYRGVIWAAHHSIHYRVRLVMGRSVIAVDILCSKNS